MKLATAYRAVALLVAIVAAVLLLASGPVNRFGPWGYEPAFALLRVAAYSAIAGAALALAGLLVPKLRAARPGVLATALVISAAVFYFPWQFGQNAKSVPPIHDVTTDTENPPPFVAVLARRAGAPNGPAYDGPEAAAAQKKGYPDIVPLVLKVPLQIAYTRALDTAQRQGWDIVASDPASGRIEATASTLWFGFKDDIVIRVTPEGADGTASRVDVRSKSRVGRSDVGANARRIRTYLAALRG